MSVVIVTGSSGLIGSETVRHFHGKGLDIVGIDNNMRSYFFGADGSTDWNASLLRKALPKYTHENFDIRDEQSLNKIFNKYKSNIKAVIHCAAQPSHDWAAKEPLTDFTVNALATVRLLEATRTYCPDAAFLFTSTNKVYGDTPNRLPLIEKPTRWELDPNHPWSKHGIDETMSIDQSTHSVFGASKIAADVMAQEYGRYFGIKTGTFRGGCLTGPAHSGAELHGFLAYLVKCQLTGRPYTIFGYKGKQVRDNIHATDLVNAFWYYFNDPKPGAVYNMGGARHSNCSMLEAMTIVERLSGRKLEVTISDKARIGDHIWWISDVRRFQEDYPQWKFQYSIEDILKEIVHAVAEREKIQLPNNR